MPQIGGHHSWRCQPRDIHILYELTQLRAYSIQHIAQLFFDGRKTAAYKRLAILRRARLIATHHAGESNATYLLRITLTGYRLLVAHGLALPPWFQINRRQRLNQAILHHELNITDIKVALALAGAIPGHRISIAKFTTSESQLRHLCGQRRANRDQLRPDAYLAVTIDGRMKHFFIEVDRSSQATKVIQAKAAKYRKLYRSGKFAKAMGKPVDQPQLAPFRVLFVCQTAARCQSLAASMLALVPPVRTQCILATIDDVRNDPFGPIWFVPHVWASQRVPSDKTPLLMPLISDTDLSQKRGSR